MITKISIYCKTTDTRFESIKDVEECPYSKANRENGGYICSELDHRKCPINYHVPHLIRLEEVKDHFSKLDENLEKFLQLGNSGTLII